MTDIRERVKRRRTTTIQAAIIKRLVQDGRGAPDEIALLLGLNRDQVQRLIAGDSHALVRVARRADLPPFVRQATPGADGLLAAMLDHQAHVSRRSASALRARAQQRDLFDRA